MNKISKAKNLLCNFSDVPFYFDLLFGHDSGVNLIWSNGMLYVEAVDEAISSLDLGNYNIADSSFIKNWRKNREKKNIWKLLLYKGEKDIVYAININVQNRLDCIYDNLTLWQHKYSIVYNFLIIHPMLCPSHFRFYFLLFLLPYCFLILKRLIKRLGEGRRK